MQTTFLTETLPPSDDSRGVSLSPPVAAGVGALLCVLGLATIWSTMQLLWELWTTDALKSIGMVVPVVSFVLVLRVWRRLGWEQDGSWWGFGLLVATFLLVRLRDQTVMVLELGSAWHLYFPPASLVMVMYGVGAVLLFGGRRLVRASVFPLALLALVNPVPHFFNVYVDLPLQRVSAHVARGFAHALGQPLSPDKLRLMFTPEFGMFIAPGCNGIRGAVTMGMIALVAGYLYKFRWRAHVLVVLGAVMLGYVFNFVRLCVLVLFYLVALHFPSLQDHAENADYLIGAVLFFVGVYLLYVVIQRVGGGSAGLEPVERETPVVGAVGASYFARTAAMTVLVALAVFGVARGMMAAQPTGELKADETALGAFPQKIGAYTLVRSWNENLLTGPLLFHWAEYAAENGGPHVSIGISPVLGSHDTLICHTARGEDPLWHGQETISMAGNAAVNFSVAFYNDGATQFLEATTLCNGTSCGEYVSPQSHIGFTFSKPHASTLLSQSPERPIPILLKAETIDTTLPVDVARRELSADISGFLSQASLDALTKPYRRH